MYRLNTRAGVLPRSASSHFNQRSDLARKSSDDGGGGSDQHKLQAPVECDIPRTPTPDYADLNARFENLLGLIGGGGEAYSTDPDEKNRKEEKVDMRDDEDVVRYSCSQPPDLIPRQSDVELEEVSITLEGLCVSGSGKDALPEHIEKMVQTALKDMN